MKTSLKNITGVSDFGFRVAGLVAGSLFWVGAVCNLFIILLSAGLKFQKNKMVCRSLFVCRVLVSGYRVQLIAPCNLFIFCKLFGNFHNNSSLYKWFRFCSAGFPAGCGAPVIAPCSLFIIAKTATLFFRQNRIVHIRDGGIRCSHAVANSAAWLSNGKRNKYNYKFLKKYQNEKY